MPTTGSENSDEVCKYPQKSSSESEAGQTRHEKKGAVYEVPCKACPCVYIRETGRTLEKHLSEHKTAVKKNEPKNSIAVHAWQTSTRSTGKPLRQARGKRLLEEKGPTGPTYPATASDLKPRLETVHQHLLFLLLDKPPSPSYP